MVRALATRADGSVYVAGSTLATPADWRIIRLAADGTVDTAFGGASGMTANLGGHDSIAAIALQPDGRVLAAGFGKGAAGHGQTLVRRYLDSGSADSSFTPFRDAFGVNDSPTALARQSDGRVVVALNSKVGTDNDLVLVRLGDDGVPDDGFGVAGVSISDAGRRSSVNGVVVRSGGGPLAVGSIRQGANDVAAAIQYQPDASTSGLPARGFEVEGFGGLHPFSIGGGPKPVAPSGAPYWPGLDAARGVALTPDGKGGYTVASSGAIYAFGNALAPNPGGPSWPGQDIARGIALSPDGSGGWILDAFGGLHPFGTGGDAAPAGTVGGPHWPGFAIGRGVAALP